MIQPGCDFPPFVSDEPAGEKRKEQSKNGAAECDDDSFQFKSLPVDDSAGSFGNQMRDRLKERAECLDLVFLNGFVMDVNAERVQQRVFFCSGLFRPDCFFLLFCGGFRRQHGAEAEKYDGQQTGCFFPDHESHPLILPYYFRLNIVFFRMYNTLLF